MLALLFFVAPVAGVIAFSVVVVVVAIAVAVAIADVAHLQ